MQARFVPYRLVFKRPAGTSRGTLYHKDTYLLFLEDGERSGVGECALFRGLSADDRPDYESFLSDFIEKINMGWRPDSIFLERWPSIKFGWETAVKSLASVRPDVLFPSRFTQGEEGITINGLIWMGSKEFMLEQLKEKREKGFRVIKLKIGALDFETELSVLSYIRRNFSAHDLEIRVDANGAFRPEEALEKLKRLSAYGLHSIEQPIKPHQWEEMARLAEQSPVPIALDEELIGLFEPEEREKMMRYIRPSYIILKPSLIGGFSGADAWIELARRYGAGWWITSALESNVGLNALAQYAYAREVDMPQGLGTGGLFVRNFPSPLYLEGDTLFFDHARSLETELK